MSQQHFDEHDDHDHDHEDGLKGWLLDLFRPHEHGHYAAALDPAMSNARGIWAVKVSLIMLLVTAVFQLISVAISASHPCEGTTAFARRRLSHQSNLTNSLLVQVCVTLALPIRASVVGRNRVLHFG